MTMTDGASGVPERRDADAIPDDTAEARCRGPQVGSAS